MSILEPSIATPEQHDATELNNLNNANGELSVPKNTLDELTSLKVAIPIDEFKEEDQKVFEDENGHIKRITRKIYSQGILYGHIDFTFSNDSAGKFYMTSVTAEIYSNGKIRDSCSVFYANTNDQGITEIIETSYIYREDYTIINAHHYDKYKHLTKTVVDKEFHSGSSDTDVISYNKDGQITEVIKESNDGDSTRQVDVIRFSYNKNKYITEEVKECRINDFLQKRVETKYAVLDGNTGETYKSSIITTSYGENSTVKIDKEYFDRQGNITVTMSQTSYSNGWKFVKIGFCSYNENNHITKIFEYCYLNDVLNSTVETKYIVLDSNTGKTYKSSVITQHYVSGDTDNVYSIKSECFDRQSNITKTIEKKYLNKILNERIETEYIVSDSSFGGSYKSSITTVRYGPEGESNIVSINKEYFDKQSNKIEAVDESYYHRSSKYIKNTYYNKNKQITKTIEKYHNNSIFNRKVTTKYSVADNITGEVYKSSIISIDYNRKGVNTIKSEYFDRHKNKTEESEKNHTNNILDDEVIKQYTVLDSNSGEAYKSAKFYIKYSVVGRYRVKAEYFNEQGNIINNSDALYVNDILSFISEDYFNDSEILERNVTINTNYDPDGNVIGYKQCESKYNERGKLIDSQNTEYDIYGQEIINIKDKAPIGPGMNSLIEAIGSFSAQESVFSSIDYHGQGNMLNTFVATTNQFDALQ